MTGIVMIAVLILGGLIFMACSPEFGGKLTKEYQAQLMTSKNYRNGKFANTGDVKINMSFSNMMAMIKEQFNAHPEAEPDQKPIVVSIDSATIAANTSETHIYWFGHSTFLIQTAGKNIILDPMLGESASPVPIFGVKRFNKQLPISIEQLPYIDAVVISHDHYDHLDYKSIQKLKEKTSQFYTPLGVGKHLESWGVETHRVHELDWWQSINFENIQLHCTPAQHFSGRGKWFSDQASTLWSSWIIQTNDKKIFFSGDSGYGSHFKEIGEKYGPFDIALMECGQYNKLWKEIHMMPEETIQAAVDVKAKAVLPMHWGAFKLALHSWTDPIERAHAKAKELDMPIVNPQIGEKVVINGHVPVTTRWWE